MGHITNHTNGLALDLGRYSMGYRTQEDQLAVMPNLNYNVSFSPVKSEGGSSMNVSVEDLWVVYPDLRPENIYEFEDEAEFKRDFADRIVKAAQYKRGKAAAKSLEKK